MRRGFPITKAMRAERRARAEARNKEYNDKYPTLQAKLAALPETGASKQRAKLTAAIEAQAKKLEAEKLAAAAKAQAKAEKTEKNQAKKGK